MQPWIMKNNFHGSVRSRIMDFEHTDSLMWTNVENLDQTGLVEIVK